MLRWMNHGLQPSQPDLAKEGLRLRILETFLTGSASLGTVIALVRRIRFVRGTPGRTRMTAGAESRKCHFTVMLANSKHIQSNFIGILNPGELTFANAQMG